jgi:hypothetical protein
MDMEVAQAGEVAALVVARVVVHVVDVGRLALCSLAWRSMLAQRLTQLNTDGA